MNEARFHTSVRGAARKRVPAALAIATSVSVIAAGAAAAQVSPGGGGGTTAPGDPQVLSIQCVTRCIGPAHTPVDDAADELRFRIGREPTGREPAGREPAGRA